LNKISKYLSKNRTNQIKFFTRLRNPIIKTKSRAYQCDPKPISKIRNPSLLKRHKISLGNYLKSDERERFESQCQIETGLSLWLVHDK
jgi:hypothetical protein